MSRAAPEKLLAALAECRLHAEVLASALAHLPARFAEEDAALVDPERRRWLDQAAYRFMKLQDSLGEKVLPGLLDLTLDPLPPEAPFAQKLQRLERLQVIPSAEAWRVLREVRNALAHDYPDQPALQAAAWTRFIAGAAELLATWRCAAAYAAGAG
jgi:hypothetical protein